MICTDTMMWSKIDGVRKKIEVGKLSVVQCFWIFLFHVFGVFEMTMEVSEQEKLQEAPPIFCIKNHVEFKTII